MEHNCSDQVWKVKLVLSFVLVLITGHTAVSMSIDNGNQISDVTGGHEQHTVEGRLAGQARHRLKMLFPLLLRISARLAQIVPMVLATMGATFIMAALAKKALLISLAAFGLMLYDTFKKKHQKIHYFVEPPHENHIMDDFHFETEPHEYSGHSDEEHNSQWNKYYGGQNIYERNKMVQNVQESDTVGQNIGISSSHNSSLNNYILYKAP